MTLALEILHDASYRSSNEAIRTADVRLALAALWLILRERKTLVQFWGRAGAKRPNIWDSPVEDYYGVAKALRDAGWHAPVDGDDCSAVCAVCREKRARPR